MCWFSRACRPQRHLKKRLLFLNKLCRRCRFHLKITGKKHRATNQLHPPSQHIYFLLPSAFNFLSLTGFFLCQTNSAKASFQVLWCFLWCQFACDSLSPPKPNLVYFLHWFFSPAAVHKFTLWIPNRTMISFTFFSLLTFAFEFHFTPHSPDLTSKPLFSSLFCRKIKNVEFLLLYICY